MYKKHSEAEIKNYMTMLQNNVLPATKTKVCKHKVTISKNIKSFIDEETVRTDTFNQCNLLHRRLTKRFCIGCKNFEPKL